MTNNKELFLALLATTRVERERFEPVFAVSSANYRRLADRRFFEFTRLYGMDNITTNSPSSKDRRVIETLVDQRDRYYDEYISAQRQHDRDLDTSRRLNEVSPKAEICARFAQEESERPAGFFRKFAQRFNNLIHRRGFITNNEYLEQQKPVLFRELIDAGVVKDSDLKYISFINEYKKYCDTYVVDIGSQAPVQAMIARYRTLKEKVLGEMTDGIHVPYSIRVIIRNNLSRLSLVDLESLNAKGNLGEFVDAFTVVNLPRQEILNRIVLRTEVIATREERKQRAILNQNNEQELLRALGIANAGGSAIDVGQGNIQPVVGAPPVEPVVVQPVEPVVVPVVGLGG